ncbi:hypothetical protein [Herminiimonas sp. CN]|uniref:hypothetical protein n=1 Tax=Herminiimonas sp. CN TaxID=1349818 RepID=UPI0012DF18BB|nr:hypothetical protein [Herminiimonas sp. CN]
MSINSITDDEHYTLQKVFGLKHFNAPAHAELLEEAKLLVEKGWVVQNGNELSVPDDVMWDLHAIGKPLRNR